MTRKHLAILGSRGIPARYGGFESFAEELAKRLVHEGVAVTVFCERSEGGVQQAQFHGINLVHIRSPKMGPLSTILFDLACLWRARRDFDVVYMLGYGAGVFCFIPRLWGAAVWINMDGIEWSRSKWNRVAKFWLRMMEAVAMKAATLIVADADGIKLHLQGRHGRDRDLTVIPYGADEVESPPDLQYLSKWRLEPNNYYLVVCRLEPENHVREIVTGFVASTSKMQMIIVGDHQSNTQYVNELLGIKDSRVRYIGTVFDRDQLRCLRWCCRAYCHGHSVGGTNPSLLEALGCGNRILAHDNLFNREVASECACYFESVGDVRREIEILDASATSDSDRNRAQQRIRDRYNWDAVTHEYLALLNNN